MAARSNAGTPTAWRVVGRANSGRRQKPSRSKRRTVPTTRCGVSWRDPFQGCFPESARAPPRVTSLLSMARLSGLRRSCGCFYVGKKFEILVELRAFENHSNAFPRPGDQEDAA